MRIPIQQTGNQGEGQNICFLSLIKSFRKSSCHLLLESGALELQPQITYCIQGPELLLKNESYTLCRHRFSSSARRNLALLGGLLAGSLLGLLRPFGCTVSLHGIRFRAHGPRCNALHLPSNLDLGTDLRPPSVLRSSDGASVYFRFPSLRHPHVLGMVSLALWPLTFARFAMLPWCW